ncbi:helix-turn-helix domain-containing protein [Actinobacillus minor]|uniref:Helix-turn-helix domain-containing protein n=1 Tax=Actinobacillus minor NM305 TaxID=637911 RepID=C5S4R4_9PAST|nr:helix-turn-helix transcriptional regulator [Actinobacillus minor]EER46061.1 helix-turn-helix domain-containing protein [Actinobacillus minor NM305]MDD6910517.1 helix-turn-helix transcriptional regulator [Actinobacillus minor]MDY4713871.1 helix-turn-helix transcriptional regulator [Actinobacillus minor]MDY5107288.1 helix-turn-helix transcriptional regulator [Actinobacillus minor]
MGMHDKIRIMRELHQWSQEEMAEKMAMSPSGYAKIERGETKLQYDKLVQIAQIFNLSVADLIESDKGVVFCMNDNSDYIYTSYNGNNESLQFEIEKLKLQLTHKDELLTQKEKELEGLRKIIQLLEKH